MKNEPTPRADRRRFLTAALTAAAAAPLAARAAQAPPPQSAPPATPPAGGPPPVSPVPTPRAWDAAEPRMYPDPDIVALDPAFRPYVVFNSLIKRLYFGTSWAEGPAWNGVGRYMVWSDIPANAQMRWIEDDSRVTTFRNPSNNSNGNTFDFEGRQLSCEHGGRRVVRYEPNGQVTVIADTFEGKRLNSPNDVVVHPDGSVWFTDPSYGIMGNYEGNKAASETKEAVYRVDPKTAAIARVAMGDQNQPNGLCFSPDYKKLYVADGAIWVYDVDGAALKNGKQFVQPMVPGTSQRSGADGIRCDTDGNVWAGARPGVLVFSPAAQPIGMIRLPEVCANICFGGAKRNRLFMAASQSLYAVYVGAVGAHIA
jgi:gluconolactonase